MLIICIISVKKTLKFSIFIVLVEIWENVIIIITGLYLYNLNKKSEEAKLFLLLTVLYNIEKKENSTKPLKEDNKKIKKLY